jgi:hypothetical protein
MVAFLIYVGKMTNGVRQRQPVSMLAVEGHSFLVVLAGGCIVVKLSIHFSQQAQGMRQFDARRMLA